MAMITECKSRVFTCSVLSVLSAWAAHYYVTPGGSGDYIQAATRTTARAFMR